MKTTVKLLLLAVIVALSGCTETNNSRVHVRDEIGSDTLTSNIVTRPIGQMFSAIVGEGIEVNESVLRTNKAGYLEVHVNGYNRSPETKRFKYKVEWLDAQGLLIPSRTSIWLPKSAMGKSQFTIIALATSPDAVNFRMDTKKWE